MKNKANTIFPGAIILLVAIFSVVAFFIDQGSSRNILNPNEDVVSSEDVPISNNPVSESPEYRLYHNEEIRLEFEYPENWLIESHNLDERGLYGDIVSLSTSNTKELVAREELIPSYAENFVVSWWSSINNDYAQGGSVLESATLNEYISSLSAMKKKIGEINVDGRIAYEVLSGGFGQNSAIMLGGTRESPGVWEFAFPRTWDKEQLTDEDRRIISTIRFIEL